MSTQSITIDLPINRPRNEVWDAITTPGGIAGWWVAGNIAPVVGHRFTLDMGNWGLVECVVIEATPLERLVYAFADWKLSWILAEEDGATRLTLEHSGFNLDNPRHQLAFDAMSKGWRESLLPRLASTLYAEPA
ncbi:activator of Hsp90 ATPase-like protein [Hoeflea marina]|uniref:Activator of Hsp90 ATPase-like protein n=1 Tax=Hoeflea marina TaxID=274592 RepID=A0A317PDY9_9HYPH|nr:SRPBCC domain-containing protein [Hoeflea marina]PWV97128.1 activator of Hsp90 ATPase-like protein [Hoeflea marina]